MQQRNGAVVELNVELIMHGHRGCAPMVPHTPQPSQTSLLLLLRGSGCSLQGLAQVQPLLGWGSAASSRWMAGPGQQLPEDALISEVRFELLFQGWEAALLSMARKWFSLGCPSGSCPIRVLAGFQLLYGSDHGPRAAEKHSCDCAVGGAGPLLHELCVAGSHTDPG